MFYIAKHFHQLFSSITRQRVKVEMYTQLFKKYKKPRLAPGLQFQILFHFTSSQNIVRADFASKVYPQDLLRMRRALHGVSILIGDAFYGNQHVAAVRLHDLDLLTHKEFVLLLNAAAAVLPDFLHRAKIGVVLDVGVAVVDLAVCAVPAPRTYKDLGVE